MIDPIADAIGIPATQKQPTTATNANGLVALPDNVQDADFQYIRDNLYTLINGGALAIPHLSEIAKQSQDFHLYDSLAKLIEVTVRANMQLAKLSLEDPKSKTPLNEPTTNVNNTLNVFNNPNAKTSAEKIADIMGLIKEAQAATEASEMATVDTNEIVDAVIVAPEEAKPDGK